MNAVIAEATEMLDTITPGNWWWGGNTDHHGDVELHSYIPGKGVVDVMRKCTEHVSPEQIGKEWDSSDLGDYIEREEYIEDRLDHPKSYIAFANEAQWFVELGRDLAVYEVARNQNLPDDTPRDHPKVYRADVVDVRNANAKFIAAAPRIIRELLAIINEGASPK